MSYESSGDDTPLVGNATQNDYGSIASSTAIASEEGENAEDANESNTSRPDLVWILVGLYSAVFLAALDGTIVATLLTSIGSYFEKANQTTYVGTSYMLSMCCFTPLYGRLSDILGRKGAMLLALTLFGWGTAYCGFATSMNTLIAARAVAGMGGGGITTVTSIAISDLIPLKQRGLYQGITNILFGMGAGLGGPLGGYLNDTFGWRIAFIFQIPILAISYGLVIWKVNIPLPEAVQNQTIRARLRRIDLPGSLTLVGCVGCFLLTFNLTSSGGLEWTSPIIYGLLIFSAVSGCLFVLVEWRWSPFPIMPLRLLCQRNMLSGCIANFVGNAAAFSMIYNVPLYFSSVRIASAAEAGAHLLPHSVALSAGSVFAGWLMQRTGKLYTLTIVSALLSISANLLVSMWGTKTSQIELWFDIVPQGFGMSSLITTTLIATIASVAKEDMAVATGITYLFRTTGQVLGVSLSGAVLQEVLSRKLRQRITGPDAAHIIDRIRRSIADIPLLPADQRIAATKSYADALRVVFICQTALTVIMLIACLPIQEQPLPGSREEQEAQEHLSIQSDDAESLLSNGRDD